MLSHKGKQALELAEGPSDPRFTPADSTLAAGVLRGGTAARIIPDRAALTSVSYGTEAGLFHAAGVPSILCGPGGIARAQRPDEDLLPGELAAIRAMMRGLAAHLAG